MKDNTNPKLHLFITEEEELIEVLNEHLLLMVTRLATVSERRINLLLVTWTVAAGSSCPTAVAPS